MDEEVAKEKAEREFNEKIDTLKKRDDEKTGKNRRKRQKRKEKDMKGGDEKAMKDASVVRLPRGNGNSARKDQEEEEEEEQVPQSAEEANGLQIIDDD